MPRKNARIDAHILGLLFENPFEDAPHPLEARLVRDWPKFLARWEKLEKVAKKLGVDVGYEEVGEVYEPVDSRRPKGPQLKVHRVQLWGDAPQIEGWEFLARIDMLDREHSTVAFAPGKESQLDPALWQGGTNCDHCKVKRFRTKRYVLRNVETGEVMVVGSTCLKDFLGHASPETIALIASYLSEFNDLGAPDEGEGGGGSPSSHFFGVSELMPLLVALTKRLGFVSVKAADESMTKQSTTATLLYILYQPGGSTQARDAWVEFRKQMAPTPEDKEFAQLVIEWAKGLAGTSSYELNIRALAEADVAGYRQLSLVASMPHAYMRAAGMRQQREGRALPESKHVGTVGESITLTLHLRKIVEWDTAYGTTTMLMFSTPEGDDVVWKASKWPKVEGTDERVQEGDTYVVKGKVKEHGDYKGRPQTRIERAKILSQVDAPSHIGKPRENPEASRPSAKSWEAKRAEIAQHRMHAAAARQQARYDAEAREAVAYHDAEAERLEDELVAAGHRRPRGARYRKNPEGTAAPVPQTQTPAFRRWFGDSKVVDENGEPLVVYHGTDKGGFYAFDMGEADRIRKNMMFFTNDFSMARTYTTGREDPTPPIFPSVEAFLRYVKTEGDDSPFTVETDEDDDGVFYTVFSPDGYKMGDFYADNEQDMEALLSDVNSQKFDRAGVYEVYLRIVDPLVVDAKGASWDEVPMEEEDEDGNPRVVTYTTNELAHMARDMDLDGLIIRDVYDSGRFGRGGESGDVYVVFDEKQIKSAHSNIGTFDPDTDDIRKNPPRRKRKNPRGAARAGEVDDWVTIEECDCSSCSIRTNPRAAKKRAEGAYADLDAIVPVIANALSQHGLTMGNVEVKFTRGGKSRAGACAYSRSRNQCQIMFNGLAWPVFTEEQRLNTVLHEAAHAIQFLTTGRSDHGPVWTRIAKSIGCTGDRCMSVEASQAMVDAYSEAKGLPKRKLLTKEEAMAARDDFAVGDYVSFEHKRERWHGKITGKDAAHARVMVQQPANRVGVTGKIPYPLLQKEAPPRFADKVAGVDKPAAGESLTAWLERTGRSR
jgi:hypothetical protein